jgi:glycosyltransferase involved in cell wall biosynthesis
MNMIVGGLLDAGHRVKILAVNSYKYYVSPGEIPAGFRALTRIELIDVDLHIRPVKAFLNLFTGKSYHVERFISASFRTRLIQILQQETFDIIQFETLYLTPYIAIIRRLSGAKLVLRAHNIEHLIWSRIGESTLNPLKRLYIRHLAATLKKYERLVLSRVDGIAAITENDADCFRRMMGDGIRMKDGERDLKEEGAVISVPFGIDLRNVPAPRNCPEPFSLFTIGAMNWIPNAVGVRWFLHHVWPDLHKEFPGLRYYLAGREMPEWMLRMDFPGVTVLGEVVDARAFMDAHGIMIVPLFSGSGIRIKIIEGMAAGKTIISTRIGAEGIGYTNAKNILIANAPCEFIELISICLRDTSRCLQMGAEARKLVEMTYDRREIIGRLTRFYGQLSG